MAELLRALEVNHFAKKYHDAGLEAERSKDFIDAYANFDNADRVLNDESKTVRTVDTQVQLARIGRDRGFTWIRSAIELSRVPKTEEHDETYLIDDMMVSMLSEADMHLTKSKESTANLISDNSSRSQEVKADLFAEHGATLGLLGRLATIMSVLPSDYASYSTSNHYQEAHDFLKQGNNGYYLVSNAMNAARHSRINSNISESLGWLVKADQGLLWTAAHDRSNLKAATLTAGSRTLDLLTRSRAEDSVFTKP